jgi:hypothetical protein
VKGYKPGQRAKHHEKSTKQATSIVPLSKPFQEILFRMVLLHPWHSSFDSQKSTGLVVSFPYYSKGIGNDESWGCPFQ